MMESLWTLGLLAMVSASPTPNKEAVNTQSYKDQYCTDPRTMRKHAAYTEWADAYSCTRHRCQPGGRNLAIYTVGCKRVEAPESAIECEEVVEDTNMQFPFCCTRLRCLVVVRGEVWTRVLGQPWEVLPAAPWSHMYKMKKPPPSDTTFQPKLAEQGPIYELAEPESEGSKAENLRSARKQNPTENPDCNEVVPRAAPSAPGPDIVIALSTNNDKEPYNKKTETRRSESVEKLGLSWPNQAHSDSDSDVEHKRVRKTTESHMYDKEEEREPHHEPVMTHDDVQEAEEPVLPMDKTQNIHHQPWTEAPQMQWNDHDAEGHDADGRVQIMELRYTQEPNFHRPELSAEEKKPDRREEKRDKPNNLQALVDAIGTRMKDIENVVQKMSEKVHQTKTPGRKTFSKYAGKASAEAPYNTPRKAATKEEIKPKHEPDRTEHVRPPASNDDHYRHALKVANMTRHDSTRRLMHHDGTRLEPYDSLEVPPDQDPGLEIEGNSLSLVRFFGFHGLKYSPPGKNHNSKYLHGGAGVADTTQDSPLYIEDNGNFFSDASNSVRRSNAVPKKLPDQGGQYSIVRLQLASPKSAEILALFITEPSQNAPTYMAPVANHHNPPKTAIVSEEDPDRKKKKHSHKKRRSKTHTHKKHHNQDKRKHFNKVGSTELDKNAMSTEDSSAK